MRILVACHGWFPDQLGGLERVARELAVALVAGGDDVVALTPRVPSTPKREVEAGVDHVRGVRRYGPLPQTVTDALDFARVIRRWPRQQFDVALCHNPSNVWAVRRTWPDCPIAYVFHASGFRESMQRREAGVSALENARARVVEPPLWYLERRAAQWADCVMVLSEYSKRLIATDYAVAIPKTIVMRGGVDTDLFRPSADRDATRRALGIAPTDRVLFTARRLVARTGVGLLLDAYAHLKRAGDGLRLFIAGDGDERERLTCRAASLGVSDSIAFLGPVSDEALVMYLQAADTFVLPTVAYEGFGMATLEALSCGLPVAATSEGATPEILGALNPDWIATHALPADLARAVGAALTSATPETRDACRNLTLGKYRWDAVAPAWREGLGIAVSRAESGEHA